jgi:hypothetical protein
MPYNREPLVNINRDSNAWPKSARRKALPMTGSGKNPMDVGDPRKTAALQVRPKTNYFLDCEDDRSK